MKKILTTLALSSVLLFNCAIASEHQNLSAEEALEKFCKNVADNSQNVSKDGFDF